MHVEESALARLSVLCLTPREVVQRYGMRTESGTVKVSVYLSFADGIVMFHETEVH